MSWSAKNQGVTTLALLSLAVILIITGMELQEIKKDRNNGKQYIGILNKLSANVLSADAVLGYRGIKPEIGCDDKNSLNCKRNIYT